MKPIARWRTRWKRMTSITWRGTRAKRKAAESKRWDTDRVDAARSASRAGAMMTKIGPRLSPGSVAREQWLSRRPEISPHVQGVRLNHTIFAREEGLVMR